MKKLKLNQWYYKYTKNSKQIRKEFYKPIDFDEEFITMYKVACVKYADNTSQMLIDDEYLVNTNEDIIGREDIDSLIECNNFSEEFNNIFNIYNKKFN
jgi:hypothetical protein